ncbi:hypothetical protein [Maritalea sp. S77]|uniref:hypothetical protein n=1 Tax=Maritalea sp. S77 TaxID=3415125 RepID=UPI003C7BA84C
MKAQLYGTRVPLYKANQMWRQARAKHIQRDLEANQLLTSQIFNNMFNFTYGQNSMIIKQAAQRTLKSV